MNPNRLFFIVSLALAILSLGVTTLAHAFAWFQVRGSRRKNWRGSDSLEQVNSESSQPWLTLLKPVCGVDAALDDNLETVAQQTYPHFDVVFGAADSTEPALLHVQRFNRHFPAVATRVSLGETQGCINPKVSLLARMVASYRQGKLVAGSAGAILGLEPPSSNHWFVVSDSNVQLQPNYLAEAVHHMQPDVGLVTHLVAGCGGDNLAAALENLQINACITPAVAFVRYVTGRTCVVGKSIFIRADVLDKLGGFEAIGHVLAEDYLVGRSVESAGFKVVISSQSVRAWHQDWTFARFFNRHGRWACMRRNISLTGYLLEPLLAPSMFLVCAWILGETAYDPGWDVDVIGLGVAWTMALSFLTTRIMSGEWPGVATALLNPVREWVTLAIWTKGWFIRHIEWRGKSYRVVADSVLHAVNPEFGSGDEVPVP